MIGYFVLLCILYLVTVGTSLWALTQPLHSLFVVKDLGTIVLFSLCLRGCYGLVFKKTYWIPEKWRIVFQGTLVLGVFTVILYGYGENLGVPSPAGAPTLIDLGLMYLPYLLFAIPVILYENTLKKSAQESG